MLEDKRVKNGVPQPRAKEGSRRRWYWDSGAWQAVLSCKKDKLAVDHYLQEIRDGVEVPPLGYPLPEGSVISDTSSSLGADRAMLAAACGDAASKSSKQKPRGLLPRLANGH